MSSPRIVRLPAPPRDPATGWEVTSGRETCPFGPDAHTATLVVTSGDIRGASCHAHLAESLADHGRAVAYVERQARRVT